MIRYYILLLFGLTLSQGVLGQYTLSLPELLSSRFDEVVMSCVPQECETRDCIDPAECDQALQDDQVAEVSIATQSSISEISVTRQVRCPGEPGTTEEQTFLEMTLVILPRELVKIRICGGQEYYLFEDKLAGIPPPYEIVDRVSIESYIQTFDIRVNGQMQVVDLPTFLELIFFNDEIPHHDILTQDYIACGEMRCTTPSVACSNADVVRQDDIVAYIQSQSDNNLITISYPLDIHHVVLCGGRSLWVLDQEKMLLEENTPIELLQTVHIDDAGTEIVIDDPCRGSIFEEDIKVTVTDPTCEEPASGEIFIEVTGDAVGILTQYSIDGGETYQESPLFQGLEDGGYLVVLASDDLSIVVRVEKIASLQNPCKENDSITCSDGIDNDGDGLIDCDDGECILFPHCDATIYCMILDQIDIEPVYPNALNFTYVEDNFKSMGLDITLDEFQNLLEDIKGVRYTIIREDVDNSNIVEDHYLRVDEWKKYPVQFQQKVFLSTPVLSDITFVREYVLFEDDENNEKSSETVSCNPKIIDEKADCTFEVVREVCGDHLFITVNGDDQTYPVVIVNNEGVFIQLEVQNGVTQSVEKQLSWPYVNVIVYSEDLSCQENRTIFLEDDRSSNIRKEIALNTCVSIQDIIDELGCNLAADNACYNIEGITGGATYDAISEEICASGDGTVEILVTRDGVVYTVISLEISVFRPDCDSDGLPNDSDPDIDGDGIPNGAEAVFGDNNTDCDDLPDDMDDDIDGDGVSNEDDSDPTGSDTEICGDPDGADDDGDMVPDCEEPECAHLLGVTATYIIAPATCTQPNAGSIEIQVPAGDYSFSIDNGANFQPENTFGTLKYGDYPVVVQNNATGCQLMEYVEVPLATDGGVDIVGELLQLNFLSIKATLRGDPSVASLIDKEGGVQKNSSAINHLNTEIAFQKTDFFNFELAMSDPQYVGSVQILSYDCDDDLEAHLQDYKDAETATWAHFVRASPTSKEGTLYFGSKRLLADDPDEAHTVTHLFNLYSSQGVDGLDLASENIIIQKAEQYYASYWFVFNIGKIKELLDYFRCNPNTNLEPYNGGIIPQCFYDMHITNASNYYGIADRAFVSGVVDGIYKEAIGLMDLYKLAKAFHDKPFCVVRGIIGPIADYLNPARITFLLNNFINDAEVVGYMQNEYPRAITFFETIIDESCEEQAERIIKFEEAANQIVEFINDEGFTALGDVVWEEIKTALGTFGDNPGDNMTRYRQGRIIAQIALIFAPGVGEAAIAAAISKTVGKIANFLKRIAGTAGELAGKLWKYLDEVFLKKLDEANLSPDRLDELADDIPKGGEDFIKYLKDNGMEPWRGWRATYNSLGDPVRNVLGSGRLSHASEWNQILADFQAIGAEIIFSPGRIAYSPGLSRGKPGQLIIDPDASITALRHEYRHLLDDQAAGFKGMRGIADSNFRVRTEFNGYKLEIDLMKSLGEIEVVNQLKALFRQEMDRIIDKYRPPSDPSVLALIDELMNL